jgi:DNA-binding NtrC family response regulator
MSEPQATNPAGPRWHALLQRAADPLYLLNRRREVLGVNRAWEELTGFTAAAVRGARCRRLRDATPATLESLLSTLAPPPDAAGGRSLRVRRALPRPGAAPDLWDIHFLPITGPKGRRLLLGKIAQVPRQAAWVQQPLPPRLVALRERAARAYSLESLPDAKPAQRRLVGQVRLAAEVETPVLIVGEAGAGKEWLARTIHHHGRAAERTFAAVDCARLPPAALAAALFAEPGLCYRAHVGSLYLGEPQRLPRELQAKLCELLASPPPAGAASRRPRLLAGCSADPQGEVRAGRLLEELHCALSPLMIVVAPLRERPADLAWLVPRILARLDDEGQPAAELSPEAWDRLAAHPWPGNVAELHAVLAEALARARGGRIEAAHLPWHLGEPAPLPAPLPLPLDELLTRAERRLIELALARAGQNKTRAAELLQMWRPDLWRRMKKFGMTGK